MFNHSAFETSLVSDTFWMTLVSADADSCLVDYSGLIALASKNLGVAATRDEVSIQTSVEVSGWVSFLQQGRWLQAGWSSNCGCTGGSGLGDE